ncbi:hypothetical protein BFP72_13105 [Reichenbachiella sp. 5M10]|uniref:hypothetical protein n=1 Tax=Reichenbachiella sp. 5M10 TaxID=1889772 RepID=UPI000C146787|nr:hypothetical protein [Reichenbachiella sp. 5M10]PIB36261.1 hypothetical protein BFP72_13105 [Reichenbachiella sp. 5M10]
MKQYDTFILVEDINTVARRGMEGVILEVYDSSCIEVEFVEPNGKNIEFDGQSTFQISPASIKIKKAYNIL